MATPDGVNGRSIVLYIKIVARLYAKYGAQLDPFFSSNLKEALATIIAEADTVDEAVNPRGPR